MLIAKSSVPNQLHDEFKDYSLAELTHKEPSACFAVESDENQKKIEPKKLAPLFHELGKFYQTKTRIHCRSKKLLLIKSAALFKAAIVRLEPAFEDPQSVRKTVLQQLCTKVLLRAEAKNKTTDLIGKAHSVKENIALMRNYAQNELKDVQYISENIPEKQVIGYL